MGQFSPPVQAAAVNTAPPPLTVQQKADWNNYIDYLQSKGMKGNPALDNRDTGLSQKLFNDYKTQNPHFSLTYDQVPQIQQDLIDYRNNLVQKYKANPSVVPDAKSADEIMPSLSPADGWLGSKTSSHKYPIATLTDANSGTAQNYGTNLAAYDAAIANLKK